MTSRSTRILCLCIYFLSCFPAFAGQGGEKPSQPPAGQETDSTMSVLMNRLDTYIKAIEKEPAAVKISESDFLISSCGDSAIRQKTAQRLYDRYMESPVMGDEAVAIHIFDLWFADKSLKMQSDAAYFAARFHAETNRSSLVGCKSPALNLRLADGNDYRMLGSTSPDNCLKVIYFYDIDCPVCSSWTSLLQNATGNFSGNFYAVYTGTDREGWIRYIGEKPIFKEGTVNLWDPDRTSDFEMLYGVIRTPSIFLVDRNDIIIGRRLDPESLGQMLAADKAAADYEYGGKESIEAFRSVFVPIEDGMGCEGLSKMASHISRAVLEKGDTAIYKQMTGDLLYFIAEKDSENYKCGTAAFVDKFILERTDIWNTPDDSLKVISLAGFLKDLSLLSPIGSRLPKVRLPAVKITSGRKGEPVSRNVRINLAGQKSSLLIFRLENCTSCKARINDVTEKLLSKDGLYIEKAGKIKKIILVDMNNLWENMPDAASILSDNIDLTALPMVIATDCHGNIARKYL